MPSIGAGQSVGLPARTAISPRLNRASPGVMCLVRQGGSNERPLTGHPLRLQRVVSDRRDLGSALRHGDRSAFHLGRDV
jgi:hypothetical protein